MNIIKLLTREWSEMTEKLLKCELIDIDEIKDLCRRSHNIIHNFSNKDTVPKEMCNLILELQWFSWWIADAQWTPMHGLYQELGNVVTALHGHFFNYDDKYNDIETFLAAF